MRILVVVPSGQKEINGQIIPAKYSGVDYHRLLVPHAEIGKDVDVSQINSIEHATADFLSDFDIVVVNRFVSRERNNKQVLDTIKASGAKLVVDLDDDYKLPDWHILAPAFKAEKHAEQILFGLKHADAITTTHEGIAETLRIETMNKNVFVVPNAIDTTEPQWEIKPSQTKRITFGWSGSITHFDDVMLMNDSLWSMYRSNYKDQFAMVYGGHDPKDQHSNAILGVLSCKGMAEEKNFATFPATGVDKYAYFYDNIDVALIPLRDNRFNRMKSNLKLLEAGFKKKAAIVSGVHPYLPVLKNGVNCLVANTRHDWYKHMTKLINNPNLIKDLADQLHEDVKPYDVREVAQTRLNIYKQLCTK
jgi:hypothetical protein